MRRLFKIFSNFLFPPTGSEDFSEDAEVQAMDKMAATAKSRKDWSKVSRINYLPYGTLLTEGSVLN